MSRMAKVFDIQAGAAIQRLINGADKLYEAHLRDSDAYQVEVPTMTPSSRPDVEYILLRREHAEVLIGTPPK